MLHADSSSSQSVERNGPIASPRNALRTRDVGHEVAPRRRSLAGLIAFLLIGAALGALVVYAPNARAAASISTDKPDYSPEEVVTIAGSGFVANGNVDMNVTRPNGVTDSWSVASDGGGAFTTTYQLDGITGNYTVNASDGTNSATTSFTDAAGNLDQCTNGKKSPLTLEPCRIDTTFSNWVNGNANENKAHWREAEFISYRDTLSLDAAADYVFKIQYDTVHGGKHAIDYLGSFDPTETTSATPTTFHANNNEPCSDKVSGCTPASPTASTPIPSATLVDCATSTSTGTPTQVAGNIKFFAPPGATFSGLSACYASQNDVQGSDQCSTSLNIAFTISGTFPMKIVIAWGGHISSEAEWGSGTSASFISGSPYHMAQISLTKNGATVSGVGNQDRALEASAVFFIPSIAMDIKNAADGSAVSGGNVPAGTTVYDTATLTGASSNAGCTVFYAFYTNLACSGTPSTNQSVTVSSAVVPNSPNKGPLSTGPYSYRAYYAGGSLNFAALSPCEPLTVAELSPTVVTEIHDASHNVVTSVALGTTVHDKATVSGSFGTPTGTVTFTFFTASSACTGASVSAGTVTLDASGVAHPSSSEGPLAAGSYSFKAAYSGDANYTTGESPCEPLTVTELAPTVATEIHNASHAAVTSVPAGTTVHDKATVSGSFGVPTGTVSFTFFTASSACTGASVASGTVALDASGVAHPSSSQGPLGAGSYSFRAHYNGEDPNYTGTDSPCEPLTVEALTPIALTEIHDASHTTVVAVPAGTTVHDKATVSGSFGVPTGTVSFTFFTACSVCTGASVASGTVALDASGVAHPSSSQGPLGAGSYAFRAHYNGEDPNYGPADSPCEPLEVAELTPTALTEIHDANHNVVVAVPAGSTVHDKATLTGAFGTPTGTVTFTFFTASSVCTGASVAAGTVALDASGVAHPSTSQGPLSAGSYSFRAHYNGEDPNYAAT